MSARRSFDPVTNFSFEVEGITQGKFAAADGLSYEIEMIEYRVSDEPMLPRYRPGLPKYGRITLKRGYVLNPALNEWIAQVQAGNYERKDGSIVLLDYYGEEVRRWNLLRCLPTKWSIGSLDGKGTEALMESIELVVEEVKKG